MPELPQHLEVGVAVIAPHLRQTSPAGLRPAATLDDSSPQPHPTRILSLRFALAASLLFGACSGGDVEVEIDAALPPESVAEVQRAANRWNDVCARKLVISSRGDFLIILAVVPGGWNGHFDGGRWGLVRIDPSVPREHIYAVALHELGHVLGLRHVGSGVMEDGTKRPGPARTTDFTPDDLAEARAHGC